jgi:hypothetical protein
MCIEKFYQETFPTVEITCKRKNVSKLYEWFWKGSDSSKVYDVNITKTGEKTVTVLKMSSGNVMIVDEDISVSAGNECDRIELEYKSEILIMYLVDIIYDA